MRRVLAVVLLSTVCAMSAPIAANAATAPSISYPQTRKTDLVENECGTPVADPYRWLENDVRNDPEVASWVAAENRVTDSFLQTLPLRDWFKQRMTALYDYERYGLPVKKGRIISTPTT